MSEARPRPSRKAARRRHDAGITLVEMLAALAVSAAIGLAGITMLDAVLRVGARAEGRLERLSEADRAFVLLGRDVLVAAPAKVRLAAEGVLLLPRADGGAARWSLDGGTLTRRTGATGGAGMAAQGVLPGASELTWEVLGPGGWAERWPPADGDGEPAFGLALAPRAVAVRITVEGAGLGNVRRLWELADAPPRTIP